MKILRSILIIIILSASTMLFSACSDGRSRTVKNITKAPDFTLEDLNGNKVTLSEELKGKMAVLVFFTTWCPHCIDEVPFVNKFYAAYKDKVSVIGVNIEESKRKVAAFNRRRGVTYPIVLDSHARVAVMYGIIGIPEIVAIDSEGNILYMGHDIIEMERKVKF